MIIAGILPVPDAPRNGLSFGGSSQAAGSTLRLACRVGPRTAAGPASLALVCASLLCVSPLGAQQPSGASPGTSPPAVQPGSPLPQAVDRTSDPEAIAIVDAYLKAIGGVETLSKIKDKTTKFRNLKHAANGVTEAELNLYQKDGPLIREEWDIKGFDIKGEKLAFVQIYNGEMEEGWVQMLGTVSALDGRTLQVFVWDKYLDDFFAHWKDDGYTLKMGGQGIAPAEVLGEELACDVVQVADFTGRQSQRYFFSKKDGLLVKKEWQDAGTNPRAAVKKEQYYRMYRDIGFSDGSGLSIKFPVRLEIYQDGDLDTERIFTLVKFNSNLSAELFGKPEGKPFEGFKGGPNEKLPSQAGEQGAPDTTAIPLKKLNLHPSGHGGAGAATGTPVPKAPESPGSAEKAPEAPTPAEKAPEAPAPAEKP